MGAVGCNCKTGHESHCGGAQSFYIARTGTIVKPAKSAPPPINDTDSDVIEQPLAACFVTLDPTQGAERLWLRNGESVFELVGGVSAPLRTTSKLEVWRHSQSTSNDYRLVFTHAPSPYPLQVV